MEHNTALARARAYEQNQLHKCKDRPSFHLSPLTGWMNDPNGFCCYQGKYHLFYQYYPYDIKWGPMHWGHAVSADLLHWEYLPCALAPDSPADAAGCFSGSAVTGNKGELLLYYTGVQQSGDSSSVRQIQCLAIGDGLDFVKYESNPILDASSLPEGCSPADFRDPKVWMENGRYNMVVASRHEQDAGSILLYQSTDGHKWNYVCAVDASRKEYGQMWECPDFFALDGESILLVSPQEMSLKPGYHEGFVTLAVHGEGQADAFQRKYIHALDEGIELYAPQTTLSPDGRRIMIGWMNHWDNSRIAPRDGDCYGQMSLPRELRIEKGRLIQAPVRELLAWRKALCSMSGMHVEKPTEIAELPACSDTELHMPLDCGHGRSFTLRLFQNTSGETRIHFDLENMEMTFDRMYEAYDKAMIHSRNIALQDVGESLDVRLITDRQSIEIFLNRGKQTFTAVLPAASSRKLRIESEGGLCLDLDIYSLQRP